MCLLLFAWKMRADYPLILAANRDEFYDRPSAPADFWEDSPEILAGRDLREGGAWLGMTKTGRIAALTNYRDPKSFRADAPSRGEIVRGYLRGSEEAKSYLATLEQNAFRYNGFNLLVGDRLDLYYFSNRTGIKKLDAGIYGISNSLLDVPWPKIRRGKEKLARIIASKGKPSTERLLRLLHDRNRPSDDQLPDTGVGLAYERMLSPMFIQSVEYAYGTRSSTAIVVDRTGQAAFSERVFDGQGIPWMTTRFIVPAEK